MSVRRLAGAAKDGRNRAIDFYRALAMVAVAGGHWLAISLHTDAGGSLHAGNALDLAPQFAPISWLLQVMPLFFVVGGFASAASLDAHYRTPNVGAADWVAARLRRLFAPVTLLAAFWLAVVGAAAVAGAAGLALLAAGAAAIPLWFIANYTIDTAIAPRTLPLFRSRPAVFTVVLVTAIAGLEALRFAELGRMSDLLPQVNWVLGWLGFQVAGFAWKDGLIRPGAALTAVGAVFLGLATILVVHGPYPVSMVHFEGIGSLSPTHPPSLALIAFGIGYSSLAISMAPAVNRLLDRRPVLWTATVAANGVAMSVYLWHFTAAAAVGAGLFFTGSLPTAAVGSGSWWLQKLPMIALSTILLGGIVAIVSRVERAALLAPRAGSVRSYRSMLAIAAVLSLSVKAAWASQTPIGIVSGAGVVVAAYALTLHATDRTVATTVRTGIGYLGSALRTGKLAAN